MLDSMSIKLREKEKKLGFIPENESIYEENYPKHYSIKDYLIPSAISSNILDNQYNLTKKGFNLLKDWLPSVEKNLEWLIQNSSVGVGGWNPENDYFHPLSEMSLIVGLIPILCSWKSSPIAEKKEISAVAANNHISPALLYTALACYAIRKGRDNEKLKKTYIL